MTTSDQNADIEKTTPKILFVADKWCAGKYEWGVSEWEKSLVSSLKSTGLADVSVFHFDEYYHEHGKRGDEAFLQKTREWKPDIICLNITKDPGSGANIPEWKTLQTIRDEFHIPMLSVWTDFAIPENVALSKKLLPYVRLHIDVDCPSAVSRMRSSRYAYLWSPRSASDWNDPGKTRDIGISYFGSPKRRRMELIRSLQKNNIAVEHGGGERQDHIPTEEYIKTLQRSRIVLGFSNTHHSRVTNARLYEATLCGSMLLTEEDFETPKFFIPYVDYIPYSGKRDLLKKAKYYLEHDEEREWIAKNGYKKASEKYTAEKFWKYVIRHIVDGEEIPQPKLERKNLSEMPAAKAVKLLLQDFLFSSNIFYRAYIPLAERANKDWLDYQFHKIKKP